MPNNKTHKNRKNKNIKNKPLKYMNKYAKILNLSQCWLIRDI